MLTIGLINCDPLTPPVIEQYGDYPSRFAELFALVSDNICWKVYDATAGELPEDPADCDVYTISGSHFSVYDNEPWIQALLNFIRLLWTEQIKTVGICFGHQAMAKALEGTVDKAPSGWNMGVDETKVIQKKSWMVPWQQQFNVNVSHQDQVLCLPKTGECLASTTRCPFAMIQFGDNFLAIQGHPEFNSDYTRFLINKRKNLLQDERYQEFLHSLSYQTDTGLLARWMMNFLTEKN